MKKFLLTLCLLMAYATLHADTAYVDGITWTYQVSNGEAQIYKDYYPPAIPSSTSGAITIPATLGGYPVTSIGEAAFYGCTSLTSVTIPSSVTSIGEGAFYFCYNLTSVTIPEGVTSIGEAAFYGCTSLTSVTIPSSVTTIGDYAFESCLCLTSVTIPSSVTSIGDYAFSTCDSLTSVHISDLAAWCGIDFGGVYGNPLCYAKNLYLNGELITDLIIPSSVTSIGARAFYHCSSLTSVTIPSSVTTIGDYVFLNCSSLTSVTIPEGVTSIGDYAFSTCDSLTSVTIPSSVTSIGARAFEDCSGLTSVDFKGKPPSVGSNVFYNISSSAMGSYLPQYASEWKPVIDANGKWNGLTMEQCIAPDITLVFNANGGTGGKTITQVAGRSLAAPTVTRTGYTFTGWSPAVPATVPAQNVTYTAQWKINQYTLTFKLYDGTQDIVKTQDYGSVLTAPIVTREGYTFTGWSPEVPITVPANNTTYTAQWEALPRYDVVVNVLGAGTVSGTGSYWGGATVSLVATANEGHLFCGWSTTPVVMEATYVFTMPAESVTLTAYFAPKAAIKSYINGSALMSKDEAVQEALDANEVFTADEMKEMAFGAPVVEVKEDVIEIAISLQTAESLDAWQAMALQGATLEIDEAKGQVRVKVPKGDKKATFYKFIVPTEQ